MTSSESPETVVRIEFDGDSLVVRGEVLDLDRQARVYFGSLLGGASITHGWRIPRRRRTDGELALQVNTYLNRRGFSVSRDEGVDESVRHDEERQLSFLRTREAARALREGRSRFSTATVLAELDASGWIAAARPLRDHQIAGVIHGLTVGNPANFSVPGAGKTATTLALASVHHQAGTIDSLIVVGPLSSFRPWEHESAAATPWLRPQRIRGTPAVRRLHYRQIQANDLVIISYPTAATDQRQLIAVCNRLSVMLVVDESHRVKRFRGGTWAPALVEIAKHARVRVVLSGTPMPQSGRDLYSQFNILWPGRELTGPRDPFAVEVRDHLDRILNRVLPFVSRTPKSALGLRPPTIRYHNVGLDGIQEEIYRLVAANLRRRVEAAGEGDRARLDALRRGRPIRLLQAATNPELLRRIDPGLPIPRIDAAPTLLDRLDAYDVERTPPIKNLYAIDLLTDIVAQQRKAVVWGSFILNLDSFSALARARLGVPVFQVDGRVPTNDDSTSDGYDSIDVPETRERVISRFLDHKGAALLVANPASCSESISLHTACHTAVYLDRTYDCAQWLQSIDRIHRLGLPKDAEVEVHVLVALVDGQLTADGLVHAALTRKETVMRQLLEGAEIRPLGQSEDALAEAEGDDEDLRDILAYLLGLTDGHG
jgi:SNF2-related domain